MANLGFLPSEAGEPTGGGKVLAEVPAVFPVAGLASLIGRSQGKFRAVSPGQRRAICPELEPAMYETIFGDFPENYSRVTKWMPRGGPVNAPVSTTVPVTIFSVRVPDGSRFWLETLYPGLAPAGQEGDYYWQLLVNGIDVLNYGQATATFTGRPGGLAGSISLGQTRDQQPCAGPGSLIELVVLAINVPAILTDKISATLVGSLEGVRP